MADEQLQASATAVVVIRGSYLRPLLIYDVNCKKDVMKSDVWLLARYACGQLVKYTFISLDQMIIPQPCRKVVIAKQNCNSRIEQWRKGV